ncbi:MAG: hypothetical protein AAGA56_16705 [Myxococcota bacterium]
MPPFQWFTLNKPSFRLRLASVQQRHNFLPVGETGLATTDEEDVIDLRRQQHRVAEEPEYIGSYATAYLSSPLVKQTLTE